MFELPKSEENDIIQKEEKKTSLTKSDSNGKGNKNKN